MIVKLLTEQHLEFLSLKGGCRGSSESTLVKMPHCWKSHIAAYMVSDRLVIGIPQVCKGIKGLGKPIKVKSLDQLQKASDYVITCTSLYFFAASSLCQRSKGVLSSVPTHGLSSNFAY